MLRLIHKIVAFIIGLATLAVFGVMFFYTNRLALLITALTVAAVVSLLAYRLKFHASFWELYFYVEVAVLALFSIVEWSSAKLTVAIIGVVGAMVVAIWSTLATSPAAFLHEKPLRRAVIMFIALAVFGYVAFGQALIVLFPNIQPLLVHTMTAVVISYGAYLAWTLYYDGQSHEFFVPTAVMFGLSFEISLVISMLSLGYLASAFMISWLWYIAQLFVRFHFGRRDIIWRKQRWFLIANTMLMVLFVYLVRFV